MPRQKRSNLFRKEHAVGSHKIDTLFLDIGGVLLTNGWDRSARKRATEKFHLDMNEMDERHHLTFDTYEAGKLSLDDYLTRVIFHENRSFTRNDFKKFMFDQSRPLPGMIDLVRGVKTRHALKVAAVNNEGRELSMHRIRTFNLESFIDCFVSSCFVHFRKPDADIYRAALDIVQAVPEHVLYIDDRAMFVDVAQGLGINGIHHKTFETTKAALESFGLYAEQQL
jgi:putative hydrolase of the HAD superfamily